MALHEAFVATLPPWLAAWGPFLLVFLGALAFGAIFERIVLKAIRRVAKATETKLDDLLVKAVHPALAFAVFLGVLVLGLRYFGAGVPPLVVAWTGRLAFAIIVALVALVVARLAAGLFAYNASKEPRWTPAATLGTRLTNIVVFVLGGLVILHEYGVSITPLLTSLGIAGLAVALALQDTLSNFFAGMWIQTGKSLWPGHYVKIEDRNIEGFVIEIGWRTTKLRTLPGNVVIVPNHVLAQSTITDYWLPEPKMGSNLTVVTGFEADPDKVVPMILEEIQAATDDVDYILKDPAPFCRLNKRVDNGWEFWMSFWIPYYYNQWNAKGLVLNRIRRRFLKEGIRMPYPIHEQYNVPPDRPDLTTSIAGTNPGGNGSGRRQEPAGAAVPASRPSQQGPE